ncbi:hypothetical protein T484DRAFT_1800608 [Baffinella frigidus]|nr:hypothetical protein T484DRAFT_1800608 [Cryptophyta sp. CCMP2293]
MHLLRFQLPYTEKDVPVLTPEDLARRTALRQEQKDVPVLTPEDLTRRTALRHEQGERLKVMAKEKRETKMRPLSSNGTSLNRKS